MNRKNSKDIIGYNSCSRREFIRGVTLGFGLISMGSFTMSVISSCSNSGPTESENNDSITVDISLPENQTLETVGGAIAIGTNSLDKKGMLIYRDSEVSVTVFSRKCTHKGCVIGKFQNGISSCPCHGSQYDTFGRVVTGPAPRSLKQYNSSISGNIITITG